MIGNVIVQTPEEYAAWVKEQLAEKAGTAAIDDATPDRLAASSSPAHEPAAP
jgi:heme/copper-type cytochrome/quinol oxidase subunit 2